MNNEEYRDLNRMTGLINEIDEVLRKDLEPQYKIVIIKDIILEWRDL